MGPNWAEIREEEFPSLKNIINLKSAGGSPISKSAYIGGFHGVSAVFPIMIDIKTSHPNMMFFITNFTKFLYLKWCNNYTFLYHYLHYSYYGFRLCR